MKKKNKQVIIFIVVIIGLFFPIIMKVTNLDLYQIVACISFYNLIEKLFSNFKFGEALLTKLSIIT